LVAKNHFFVACRIIIIIVVVAVVVVGLTLQQIFAQYQAE